MRGTIMHVDFLAVDASTRITTEVAVHLVGASPIVELRQAVLVHILSTLSVEALSADLVDSIDVDISGLNEVGDAIHVRDLDVPDTLTILNDPDEMIVRISPIRALSRKQRKAKKVKAALPSRKSSPAPVPKKKKNNPLSSLNSDNKKPRCMRGFFCCRRSYRAQRAAPLQITKRCG